jgi:putative flippase GtrA
VSQFARFCAVGASGYVVNLAVYTAMLAVGSRSCW